MAESLGEKLRKAREERDISISEVAEQTRISALYLEAIEKDDYSPLPGGIFNKGFIKSFAKYVGVDEAEALQDYARIAAAQEKSAGFEERYKPEVLTDDRSFPSLIPTIIFSVIILGLLAWGVMLLVNYLRSPAAPVEEAANRTEASESPASPATPTPEALPSTDEIRLQIKTTTDDLSLQTTVDGETGSVTVPAGGDWNATAKESVKVVYYKGLAPTLEIILNGKKLETPVPPPDYNRNGFEFEINKGNIKGILETGKISGPTEQGAAAPEQQAATGQ